MVRNTTCRQRDLPVPEQGASMHAGVSDHAPRLRRGRLTEPSLALTRRSVLPSSLVTLSAPGIWRFRGSMASLHDPLPTLRPAPHGTTRTARGRCDSLGLHRKGLSPPTPCRSPGALPTARTRQRPRRCRTPGAHWRSSCRSARPRRSGPSTQRRACAGLRLC
jgi:hypothetical protein